MEYFLARQPIFDTKKEVYGYELLYRGSIKNIYNSLDPDSATVDVIINTFIQEGILKIVENKKAFINFTKELIEKEFPSLLPKDIVVIEILEDIPPDENFLKIIKNLKNKGYIIAIDDFIFQEHLLLFVELADIIKVDFLELPLNDDRARVVKEFKKYNIKFLAEKVETIEDYNIGKELGYELFQGYFFSKPQLIKGRKIPENKIVYLQLINEASKPDLDFRKIEKMLKRDVSLPIKLLRYVNSPFFGFRSKIESVRHALALLGEKEFKKWISLISLVHLGGKFQEELIKLALTRAKLFEELSKHSSILLNYKDKLFLTGILSTVDAILQKPMEEILDDLNIADDIKEALLGKRNVLNEMIELAKAVEYSRWDEIDKFLIKYKINQKDFNSSYVNAIVWTQEILKMQ